VLIQIFILVNNFIFGKLVAKFDLLKVLLGSLYLFGLFNLFYMFDLENNFSTFDIYFPLINASVVKMQWMLFEQNLPFFLEPEMIQLAFSMGYVLIRFSGVLVPWVNY
jgi:hypothetical protein